MRPIGTEQPMEVAEHRELFGIAEHYEKTPQIVITDHPVVTQAKKGDFYRFMRNAGGLGGHKLKVKNFRVVATVCRVMPQDVLSYEKWSGEDFRIYGPKGPCCPEIYFDGPELPGGVKKLSLSVTWQDQGWGNRKGELFLKLMRPVGTEQSVEVAEHRELFGIAEHYEKSAQIVIQDHPVVTQAKKGDFYRFMRNAGGLGGHELRVKNFRVVATVCKVVN